MIAGHRPEHEDDVLESRQHRTRHSCRDDPAIRLGAGPAQGHDGSIFGFHTQAFWFPDKQTAICAVTNQDNTSPNDLTVAALKALFAK